MSNTTTHTDAQEILDSTNLSMREKGRVTIGFASMFVDEYPFIKPCNKGAEIDHYRSEIEAIQSLVFTSENEVILANAIYENTKDNFNLNTFVQQLKFTFRLLGVDSEWAN